MKGKERTNVSACMCVSVNVSECVCLYSCVRGWVHESQQQLLRIKSSYGRVYLFAAGSAISLSFVLAHAYTHAHTHFSSQCDRERLTGRLAIAVY